MRKRDVHYFAIDGSYGHADGINLIETDKWQEAEWELVAETPDDVRAAFALCIAQYVRLGRPDDFWTSNFEIAPQYRRGVR